MIDFEEPSQDEIDAVLRSDFLAFVGKTFGTLNPAKEMLPNWHHRAIAHALMEVMDGTCRRLIINIPPRYMKSNMASVAFPAYFLGHYPAKRIICASPNPAINVTWPEAQQYAAWLSRMTGKSYRLLSEAQFEYAERGGTQTAYPWGNEVGKANADCRQCGSRWDGISTAPVGSFHPNSFGLYDVSGNVWQWLDDCYHPNYADAPADGSAWVSGGCSQRVVRGGSWDDDPAELRSADRNRDTPENRFSYLGIRVARQISN